MPNYNNAKIYTIRCRNDDKLIYVGSTIQPLYKRFHQHKKNSLKYPNCLLYSTINNEWDNWYIELYENYLCFNKEELCKKEGEVIRLIGNLNKYIAGRNNKEYYDDNKDIILEKKKEYYDDNKDKLLEQKKEYWNKNKDILSEKAKEYYNENKNILLEKAKEYYQNKRDTILDTLKEKTICECGCEIVKHHLKRHQQSKKHINLINSLPN